MTTSNIFLLSILVIMASFSSISHSLPSFLGFEIGQINIRGDLTCSLTGNPNAPPVSNATVRLVCADTNTTIAEAVTNPAGVFNFVLNSAQSLLFLPDICGVVVNLPTGTCEIYPPDAILTASINLLNFIISGHLAILNYVTGPFLDMTV